MPKQVDHAQRRGQLAEAVGRVAAQEGLEAVSLARVAQEAGVSKGRVQHYFGTRDDLLAFTLGHLRERVDARLRERLTRAQPDGPLETVREVAAALLPVDETARTEALVANAFLIRALAQPDTAEKFRHGHTEILALLTSQLTAAQTAGELRAEVDPAREADILLAVVGGISDAVLIGHHTPQTAQTVLDYHLDRLVPWP
ncbi:TetR/AcrR family transcriptional regulator [Actinokineospora sp. 24-640]